jgi:hypothetical protein
MLSPIAAVFLCDACLLLAVYLILRIYNSVFKEKKLAESVSVPQLTDYKTASESSYTNSTISLNSRSNSKAPYFNMDKYLEDCVNFQIRATAFWQRRDEAMQQLVLPSDAKYQKYQKRVTYVSPPPTKPKKSFKKRIKNLFTGCLKPKTMD